MTTQVEQTQENDATAQSPGRLIIQYLQENKDGASLNQILQHLQKDHGKESSSELSKTVESILENGTTLGFLERKGSRFMNWIAREMCCRRRRRSRCRRRRKRCSRRRRSRRRKRRCRC